MGMFLRFLLRFILIPLGGAAAITVGMLVLVVAHWNALQALAEASPEAQEQWLIAFVIAGPVLALLVSMMTVYGLTAAGIGVVISEIFAIRSWIYHAANGALSAWIGWVLVQDVRGFRVFADPTTLVAAGLAGGLAYWLIAGWSAGFMEPVCRDRTQPVRR